MPLVLEMMATWLTVMPSDRLTSISDLYELEHPLQDVDDRHKTIERCFEYSWSLLSVEHQNLAAAAAIFHTDFSFTGLQAVTGALIKDIFSVTHSSFLAHSSDGGFKQHAMVKYFCLQKLKANSKHFETVQENYINYYSGRVKELQKSYDQNQTLVGHKVNIDNLWDVACLLVKQGKANRIAYFVQTLSLYNVFTNDIVRGRSQIEHLLELIEDGRKQGLYHTYSMNEAVSLQIVTMLSHGSLIYINSQIGDIKKAQKILDEHGEDFHGAISTLQTINPTIAMFHKCFLDYCAANILTLKMNFVESKQILDKILEFEHVEHPTLQSFLISVRILQSHNLLFLGEYHDALAILQTNIEKHGDFDLRVQSYSNMATSYLVLGQRDLAKHYISLAQADMESTGVREFTYDIPFTQALIMIIEERFEEARVLIEQTNDNFFAHPSKQTKYDFRYSIRYFFTLATLYDRQNKTELLRRLTNQASAKATEHDDVHVLLTASYFSARAESATQAEQSKERFEYVYEHPQTPHYIKELAELELHSLNSSFASNL